MAVETGTGIHTGRSAYIPKKESVRLKWGEANGTRKFYMKRNLEIVKKYRNGAGISDLSKQYCLSEYSIKDFNRDEKSHIIKDSYQKPIRLIYIN